LERKWQFGKQFAEIMGVAMDAQKSVSEVESTLSDKILEQYSSFTRTTDEIKMEVGELSESNETLNGNVAALEVRSGEISAEVAQVTETTETLKTETGELKGQTETLIEEVVSLKVTSDEIRTEVSNVKTTTETLQQDAEETDAELEEIRETIVQESTSIVESFDSIMLSALNSYVTKGDYEDFKRVLTAEFEVWSEGIMGRVSKTEQDIKTVDGDLQEKFNTIIKYFTFTIDGLTIGQVDNPNKVIIDNDDITILVNDKEVVTFKADGSGLIPILNVTKSANLLGLQMTQDSTHINWDYVGEVT
jgi:chromosome segregation ATPase